MQRREVYWERSEILGETYRLLALVRPGAPDRSRRPRNLDLKQMYHFRQKIRRLE